MSTNRDKKPISREFRNPYDSVNNTSAFIVANASVRELVFTNLSRLGRRTVSRGLFFFFSSFQVAPPIGENEPFISVRQAAGEYTQLVRAGLFRTPALDSLMTRVVYVQRTGETDRF